MNNTRQPAALAKNIPPANTQPGGGKAHIVVTPSPRRPFHSSLFNFYSFPPPALRAVARYSLLATHCSLLLLLAACTNPGKNYQTAFANADYARASAIAETASQKQDPILWQLEAGHTAFLAGNDTQTIAHLDAAEAAFKTRDQRAAASTAAENLASLLYNDTALPYRGTTSDRILANTYKALAFLALGDKQNARVEFNRALARQDRAKTEYAAEIQKLKTTQQHAQNQYRQQFADTLKPTATPDATADTLNLEKQYTNLENFRAYPDFVNPLATYLAGLHALLENNHSKAIDLLKETTGMVPDHPAARADFETAARRETPRNRVWIIIENGLAPRREELRVGLPAWIFTDKVLYTGFSIAILNDQQPLHATHTIETSTATVTAVTLSDMDRVIRTEYQKNFRAMLTREILRTLIKTSLQAAASTQTKNEKNTANLLTLGAALYQAATTRADLRSWWTLPKTYQIAALPIPPDRKLTIRPNVAANLSSQANNPPSDNPPSLTLTLPPCDNALIYYRAPVTPTTPATPRIILFPKQN